MSSAKSEKHGEVLEASEKKLSSCPLLVVDALWVEQQPTWL